MKYELLKRTAIALFVGSVISTYSVAEGSKISTKSSLEDIASAINKNDENISKIKTDVSALAKSLQGDSENPGLLGALEEANKGINENKEALALKADQSAVDNINTELDARAKALKTLQEEKASVKDLNSISENVKEGFNSIQDKVHNLQEALAGDGTEEKPGLIKSVSSAVEELNDNIAKKADQSAVDDINAELDARAKALKTLQEEKASVKDLNSISENVKEGFNSIQDKVHNLQEALAGDGTEEKPGLIKSVSSAVEELNDNIAKKANQADVEANKAEIAKFGAQTNSNAALLLTMAGKVDQNKKDTDEAIAKNASAIVNIRNKEVLQNARLDNHGERIEANEAAISELAKATDESVKNLGNAVNDLDENLAGTQEAVAENRKDIDANAVAIDKLKETQTYKDLSKVETLVKDKADKTAVEKNSSRITDTRNKQVLQNARLDNHGERIEANEAAISELAKATDESVKNLGNAVNDLDENLAGTQEAVAENRKDIDKNASRITDTRNKQVLQNARLDNHGERIEANEAAISELAKATDESVKNLGNAVNDLDENLAGTQEAVAENRKDIDKNASRITDTRNKQVLQNARLDNHGQRIDANKAAIATNKADIATNADKIATNKADIANKADKNSVYSKSETDEKFALKADNSVVRAQATDINNLRTDVNAHTKRLDHLDNRVNKLDKDLKRGLAAQAALTGLFQPYTVGKANFTAAVGGYKSQTAVAIGTGYRYNQNIATKAGVAFTQGGGVTYNAGVNFEW